MNLVNGCSPPSAVSRLPYDEGEVQQPGGLLQNTYIHGVLFHDDSSGVLLSPAVVNERRKVHRHRVEDVTVEVPARAGRET